MSKLQKIYRVLAVEADRISQLPFSYAKRFGFLYFQTLNMVRNGSNCIFRVS